MLRTYIALAACGLAISIQAAPGRADTIDSAYQAYQAGDRQRAATAYRQLAESGNALAQYNYAMMLKRGESMGDPAEWLNWLEKAANGGVRNAAYAMGLVYENGDGAPRSQSLATHWFKQAAEAGHIAAQVSLATQYFLGRGVPQDDKAAAHWYEKAAEGGDIGAQYLIASMYEHGYGVAVDRGQALLWYTAAARQGDPVAKLKAEGLARMPP